MNKKNIKKYFFVGIIFISILFLCALFLGSGFMFAKEESINTKIKMTFDNNEIIIKMLDNPASRQLIDILPAEFQFRDFAGEEKITNFPKPLNLDNTPKGMIATAGKVFIYAPWGNMGIFYKDHGKIMDKNLIPLGIVESGLENLKKQNTDFKAKLEVIK